MKDYTIRDAAYVVEATHFESLCLWETNDRNKRVKWEHVSSGYMHQVGTVGSMPVTVSVLFAILDGVLVAFYEATSRVVDHRMVEAWLEQESLAYASKNRCDAMNFNQCLREIPRLKQLLSSPTV